jgi:SAM-dependent methyltransferase
MSFISMRRHYLDEELKTCENDFCGTVLDIGGKKNKRRGRFIPPVAKVKNWIFMNNEPHTEPDILAVVPPLPLADSSVDVVLITETLEYINDFQLLIEEIHRVLKDGGTLIASVPFLHLYHSDYESDYYRFTESGVRKILERFSCVTCNKMGGLIAVFYDLVRGYYSNKLAENNKFSTSLLFRIWLRLNPLFIKADRHLFKNRFFINTGYFVKATKANTSSDQGLQ